MLTAFLFIAFLTIYFNLFVPTTSKPVTVAEAPTIAPKVTEVETTEPEIVELAPAAAFVMPELPELVISESELEDITLESLDWVTPEPVVPVVPNRGELRKLCQAAGVKWRNAHGKNKHLNKQEMLEALGLA